MASKPKIKAVIRPKDYGKSVLTYLENIVIPKSRRKKISDTSCRTVTMGVINRPFHAFKGYSKFTEQHPKLWELLLQYAKQLDPDHQFSSVTINHNVECKPHKDFRNDGTTMIVALGDYTGGELVVEGEEFDIKGKPHYFNGFLREHYNKPFTGERYSIMFYSCKNTWDINHREQDIPIIREVYHGNQYHKASIGFGIEKGDHWLDIGAHIGCFSKKVLFYGGTVKAIEPDPESYELLCENIGESNCENKAVCSDPHPSYGNRKGYIKKGSKAYFNQVMLYPRGLVRSTENVINVHDFGDLLYEEAMLLKGINGYTVPICIKMDIEGAELQILDDCDFTCMDFIDKMVIAYHTNVDNTRTGFMRRVAKLSETFHVTHQEIKQEYINIFPNEIMIYCQRKK